MTVAVGWVVCVLQSQRAAQMCGCSGTLKETTWQSRWTRFTKTRKSTFTAFELFSVKERDISHGGTTPWTRPFVQRTSLSSHQYLYITLPCYSTLLCRLAAVKCMCEARTATCAWLLSSRLHIPPNPQHSEEDTVAQSEVSEGRPGHAAGAGAAQQK